MPRNTVGFFGESFELNDPADYEFAMVEFSEVAEATDGNSIAALAAVMTMLRAAIVTEDFDRFRATARKHKAQVQRDLMPVIVDAFRQPVPERPTGRSADSSAGPTVTEPRSDSMPAASGSLTLVKELESQGRADKAEFVVMAERARSAV